MKLLSSDYDLTLNTFDFDLKINMWFIEKFRREGNIFLLNTGRSYKDIKKEIDKFHINYDYLSCCDGNLVLNKDNKVLYCTNLSSKIYDELDFLHNKYANFKLTSYCHGNNVLEFGIKYYDNSLLFDKELERICHCYGLHFKKYNMCELDKFRLKKVIYYYLSDKLINKSSATTFVSRLENIQKCDIFTIGDHHNDLEMVRDFNGYTFPWGKSEVKKVSDGQVLSVASLIKRISR